MKTSTMAVQVGVGGTRQALSFPIYQNAAFRHPAFGEITGCDYSRSGNPTPRLLRPCGSGRRHDPRIKFA